MQYHIAHEQDEIRELRSKLKKIKHDPRRQNEAGRLFCLIEEKEVALALVKAHVEAAQKLNGALGV